MLKDRKRMIIVLLAACAACMTIGLLLSRPGSAADPAAPNNTAKWEYAVYWDSRGAAGFLEPGNKAITGESTKELAKNLGAAGDTSMAILNAIGKRGWELISIDSSSGIMDFYFKRPAK